ncbi:MAG: cyanophycin synthetase [Nevskiaceae bacterium]
MKILHTSVFVGPNRYHGGRAIRLTVDYARHRDGGPYRRELPPLLDKLAKWDADGWMPADGHAGTVHAALALQLQVRSGAETRFCSSRTVPREDDQAHVLFGYDDEEVGLTAGDLALDILDYVAYGDRAARSWAELTQAYDDFLHLAEQRALGPSTRSLIRAAEARGIPWFRLNNQSLIQMGHGRYQKRIEATTTSDTSMIATEIAKDKSLAQRILSDLGLPLPQQHLVYSLKRAIQGAEKIGYPVVVKPVDGNHGRGVTVGVRNEEELEAAYDAAREHSKGVLVESLIKGLDHRLLVISGKLEAAARRMPGHVVGDGRHTIKELVETVNRDPRRGIGHEKELTQIQMDPQAESCLADKGYNWKTVPAKDEVVLLRRTANLSTGGTAIDVTDVIHPDNREMAERAIKAVGLDIGGVDFLSDDIAVSYKNNGAAICEVNAGPGFRMHVSPSEGKPRDIAGKVLDMMFPPGTRARVPIAALTGTNGKTTTARMLAHVLRMSGHHVGLTTTDAVYINGQLTMKGDFTGPKAAAMVLRDPDVDMAVLETARGGIVRAGLGWDWCDVGAVLNVSEDHMGLGGIHTLDELAEVKRILVEVARDTAVLNADDEQCLRMADYSNAKHICWVTLDAQHPLVQEHIRRGCRAVVLEHGDDGEIIALWDGGQHIPLIRPRLIPATMEGKAVHNTQNAMFVAAMAHALGKSLDDIRQGLRTFDMSFSQTPGRNNIFDEHGFRVILDYGHNPAAIQAMTGLVVRMKPRGKRIVQIGAPGDRRNEDYETIARIIAGHFDTYICDRDDDLRGRKPEEVPTLMREYLLKAGVKDSQILVIPEEPKALDAMLKMAQPGDLLLVFGSIITRCWKQIIYFKPAWDAPDKDAAAPAAAPVRTLQSRYPDVILDERGARVGRRSP